jgi:hypothetical protein
MEQEVIHEKEREIVHEKREGFIHEQTKEAITHEHFEKPVVATSEVKPAIVETTTLKTEVLVTENFDALEKEKKGLGTKIKELFKGKERHTEHVH